MAVGNHIRPAASAPVNINVLSVNYSQEPRRIQGEHSPITIAYRPTHQWDKILRLTVSIKVEDECPVSFGLYLNLLPLRGSAHDAL
jgi:hypothetical protein